MTTTPPKFGYPRLRLLDPNDPFVQLLESYGYRVALRMDSWCEVLAARGEERFVGRGFDDAEALADLRKAMFPSAAADWLLASVLGAPSPATVTAVEQAPETTHDAATIATDAGNTTRAADVAPDPPTMTARDELDGALPELAAAPLDGLADASATSSPAAPALVTLAAPVTKPSARVTAPPAEPPPPQALATPTRDDKLKIEAELAIVDGIQKEIERDLNDLGLMAPEVQRLEMLSWIARARACVGRAEATEVHVAVAKVAKRLSELAKVLWPGNVKALQLATMPWEVVPRGRFVVETWSDAAESIEMMRAERRDEDARARRDPFGWTDADRLRPRAENGAELFRDVEATLTKLNAIFNIADAERAATALRWLRGDVPGFAWGSAMGKLRQRVQSLGGEANRLRQLLDPYFRPTTPWQELVEGAPKDRVDASAVRAALPSAGARKEDLVSWLQSAIAVLETAELVEVLAPLRAEVLALGDLDVIGDRRARRRWREIRDGLSPPVDAPAAPLADDVSEPEGEPVDVAGAAFDALVERVREHTRGKTAMFVSNREDPVLQTKLESMLGLSLSWYEATPRRVQAACDRIAGGGLDFVLSATGFQTHKADDQLAKAAKSARVTLVRVNRGRPVACVLALARELGIDEAGAA